ncbi:MAG: antitoxin [Candidatus Fischerbacteria bacterium RBG_13_37_8]|uniref:Antitoxin n=1 Tax=Candidatus Fischerbacteria bacterium RBG_13_37_8 TaxID=1817863 RepID=A0A1F5VNR3_9BACT|nr:MAG: antitoxin [Candidatus Fischerbacteria bacterium RBG_13_37_8]
MMNKERIIVDPKICHGQPCFKGTRIMVFLVLELLEAGITPEKIIADYYPNLTLKDVKAALQYAVNLIKNEEFIPFIKV